MPVLRSLGAGTDGSTFHRFNAARIVTVDTGPLPAFSTTSQYRHRDSEGVPTSEALSLNPDRYAVTQVQVLMVWAVPKALGSVERSTAKSANVGRLRFFFGPERVVRAHPVGNDAPDPLRRYLKLARYRFVSDRRVQRYHRQDFAVPLLLHRLFPLPSIRLNLVRHCWWHFVGRYGP
jgi:hypothetical protein